MNPAPVFNNMIEEKLLNLHTAFIAKVIRTEGKNRCTVQPLDKIKAYGQKAKKQAIIEKVPVLQHVAVAKGDIVLCLCAERDIAASVKGMSTTPPVGHHQIKDAIVIGKIPLGG